MPDGNDALIIKVIPSISEVSPEDWDACVEDGHPFTSHGFLSALEDSSSATADTGWMSQHLVIEDPRGGLLAVAPLYLKNNSYGEYVFDWGWADAYSRAGGQYYPKLQCSVPFTPATGARLLVRPDLPDLQRKELRKNLALGMLQLAKQLKVSSLHITFPTQSEWTDLGELGLLQRTGQQFHWNNRGYQSFDDFLGDLNSRKRKAIRKERKAVADKNLTIKALSGPDITERHWDAFYQFYLATTDKKWGQSYLTRDFFSMLGTNMEDRVILFSVEDDDQLVAGALNLVSNNTLYGRNWGCLKSHKFLHFEACYYQAIDYAIKHGLKRVEAGAQGQHKIQRGYLPAKTYSAHYIADPGFRDAVEDFITQERRGIDYEISELMKQSPFKNSD
jgi:predicted N-acyltransferase